MRWSSSGWPNRRTRRRPGCSRSLPPSTLQELLESAGFVDVEVGGVAVDRPSGDLDAYIAETMELSSVFADTMATLGNADRERVTTRIAELAEPFAQPDGTLLFGGRSLVAAADA